MLFLNATDTREPLSRGLKLVWLARRRARDVPLVPGCLGAQLVRASPAGKIGIHSLSEAKCGGTWPNEDLPLEGLKAQSAEAASWPTPRLPCYPAGRQYGTEDAAAEDKA